MQLFYCDGCGMRIKSGEGLVGPDEMRYCEKCAPQHKPASNPGFKAPITSGACGSSFKAPTPAPGAFKSSAVTGLPADTSRRKAVRADNTRPSSPPSQGPSTAVLAAAGGGVAALLVVLFMMLGRSDRTETVAAKPASTTSTPPPAATSVTPPVSAPNTSETLKKIEAANRKEPSAPVESDRNRAAAPVTKQDAVKAAPTSDAPANEEKGARAGGGLAQAPAGGGAAPEDFRENYARRRLDDLLTQEQKGTLAAPELRKRIEELTKSYGATAAGKEAAEKLKALNEALAAAKPAAPETKTTETTGAANPNEQALLLTPAAGPQTQILWSSNFDADDDFKAVGKGAKEAHPDGAGKVVKSEPIPEGYFVGAVDLRFGNVKLGPSSWVKFSYKMQGTADFCFHVVIGGRVYEKFLFGPKSGSWRTASFRLNEFSKCIQTQKEEQPPPGSEMSALVLFLGSNAGKASILIDNFTVGDGILPTE